MNSLDLLDINGNLEKSKQFIGTVGGELMQIYLVLLGMKFLQEKIEKEMSQLVQGASNVISNRPNEKDDDSCCSLCTFSARGKLENLRIFMTRSCKTRLTEF